MEEGVQFRFLSAPAEILGENGKVKALKVEIMELGEPDAKGRRKPVGTGKFETIEVTSVIGAIGQRVDLGRIAPEAMAFNRNGTVQADGVTYQTAQPDIFAGGDVVTGPKFAIDAIAAGREGAMSLHRYVHEGQSLTLARDPREFYELDKKQRRPAHRLLRRSGAPDRRARREQGQDVLERPHHLHRGAGQGGGVPLPRLRRVRRRPEQVHRLRPVHHPLRV